MKGGEVGGRGEWERLAGPGGTEGDRKRQRAAGSCW